MKITLEFDNLEESRPVLAALYGLNYVPVATPVGGVVAAQTAPSVDQAPAPRKRRTKAELEAAAAASAPPPPPVQIEEPPPPASTDWDEDDEPEAAPPPTRDDVRAALMAYQDRSTMEKAQALLKAVGGAERLGGLAESKFAEVIKAAETAK